MPENVTSKNVTLVRAMRVLDLFRDHEQLSLSEITARSGLPKTTVFRMVSALVDMGFLTRDAGGAYRLGLRFLEFGWLVAERLDLRRVALPVMQALRDEVGDAVNLVVRDGTEAIYIEKVEALHPVRVYTRIGRRAPLYAGACPRILLAYLPESEQERYLHHVTLTPIGAGTITDPQRLRAVLRETRQCGYTVSHSELETGSSAVAAPVFDHTGQVVAGLSVAGPEAHYAPDALPGLIDKVKRAAADISRRLGWQGG
ncbi:IclR family transcriptional regulator [Calditerricola yamamurae]